MAVAEVQRLAGVGDDLDGASGRKRAFGVHDVAQRHAVDVLHDDVGQRPGGGLRLTGVVDRDDRRVVQRRGVLRLAAEPKVEAGVTGQIGAQHLHRDVAVQAGVAGQVDLGHPAEPEDLTRARSGRTGAGAAWSCRHLVWLVGGRVNRTGAAVR